jgi:Glycine rich protein
VSKIFVDMTGSQGGFGDEGEGGLGGWVQASLSVTGGEILYLFVGCGNGFNGGGVGYYGHGGGASDIRTSLSDLKTRLVVAGGGGGSGKVGRPGSGGIAKRIPFALIYSILFLH